MFGKSIFKSYSGFINLFSRFSDPLLVIFAAIVAYGMRFSFDDLYLPQEYRALVLFAVFCVVLIFPLFNLYGSWRGKSLAKQASAIIVAWFTVVLLMIVILFGLKVSSEYSRLWLGWWMLFGVLFSLIFRMCVYAFLQYQRLQGRNFRRVVIAGAGDLGKKLISQTVDSPWTRFKIEALFDDDEQLRGTSVNGYKVQSGLGEVEAFVARNHIDEVWIALPLRAEERVKELLYALRHHTVNIKLIPDIFGFSLLNHSMTEIAGLPAVNLSDTPMGGGNQIIKALEDRILALLIVPLIMPLLFLIAIAIKVTSPGPILFKQKRHGWDGRVINVYKFRTMKLHDEEAGKITQASKGDSRVTPLGAFLRGCSRMSCRSFIMYYRGGCR